MHQMKEALASALILPVFDPVALSNYPKAALEEGFLTALFEIFLENAKQNLEKLKQAMAQKDFVAFSDLLHAMKGIAGNVKAKRLEAIIAVCQQIERSTFEADENTDYILALLQDCIAATADELAAFLKQQSDKHR
jgi:HPt (histidine-containing phosphotransfer) domain-containing protein